MSHNRLSVALELKEASEDGSFKGYGSVFNVKDSYDDVVEKGAFLSSLDRWQSKGMLPPMLWQHDMRSPIGKYTAMSEDTSGLYVEGKFTLEVEKAREAYALLKDKVITGLSIGYVTIQSEWDSQIKCRRLKEVDLFEVSLVTMPANEMANVVHVKASDNIQSERDFEQFLRLQGFSQSQAVKITNHGFKNYSQRDVGDNAKQAQREVVDYSQLLEAVKSLNLTILQGL